MTKQKKIGWKVVRTSGVRLKSFSAPRSGICYYQVGHPTIRAPDSGPLAVFKTRKEVRNFCGHCGTEDEPIFKCEYIQSIHRNLWTPSRAAPSSLVPPNTVFADEVTLLRRG